MGLVLTSQQPLLLGVMAPSSFGGKVPLGELKYGFGRTDWEAVISGVCGRQRGSRGAPRVLEDMVLQLVALLLQKGHSGACRISSPQSPSLQSPLSEAQVPTQLRDLFPGAPYHPHHPVSASGSLCDGLDVSL